LGPDPIRYAVFYGGVPQPWQVRCLERLAALVDVCAVPLPPGGMPALLAAAAAPGAIERLRELDLDFILCFAQVALPAEVLALPRHGVWRYHVGDWLQYRGEPAGYWEVFDHRDATAALLVRLHPDPDVVLVLREAWLRTRLLSPRANREGLLARIAHWPAQLCEEMRRLPAGRTFAAPALRSAAAVRRPPTPWQRLLLAARIAKRMAVTGLRSLFRHDQWNIGIADQPIEQFLRMQAPVSVRWLPPTPRAEFRADPFGALTPSGESILCEHFSYRDGLGYIVAIDAAPGDAAAAEGAAAAVQGGAGTRVAIGPTPPVHLSYPYLIEHGGRLLCLPESSAANEIALYEAERFPDRWVRRSTLIAGRSLVDASVFQHEGRWWLAASDVADHGANSELHLWFAAALEGPWQAHAGNPVKIDVRSARPAGAPFRAGGVLYRPAQDCSSTYGARVVINRVLVLSPDEFREEAVASVDPDPAGPYPRGLHTLSPFGSRTLLDGKRSVFVPAEFFRVLGHYLR
jgi:hypothetical protein